MSPTGSDAFDKHAEVISARRNSGGEYQRVDYFAIQDGQSARVRFLEQGTDLAWAQSHRIKMPGLTYPQDVLCLDQFDDGTPCPGCQDDNKEIRSRSTKGYLNVLWRGTEDEGHTRAPVYKRNDKGAVEKNELKQKIITGYEDSVWLWKCSKTVLEQIFEKDKRYKGLMSRDFLVTRKGANKDNTMYFIEAAVVDGGPEEVTVADTNLAAKKFDVVSLTTPGTYEEMAKLLSGQPVSSEGPQPTFDRGTADAVFTDGQPMRSSAFAK